MAGDAILVDLSDPAPSTVMSGGGPLNLLPKKKGRRSFYSLPKTLSEDDDPFGIMSFQIKRELKEKDRLEGGEIRERELLREEPSTGMLVNFEADSPKDSISESVHSLSSMTSLSGTSHMLGVSALTSHQSISSALGLSALGTSTMSAHGASVLFGNISKISTASAPAGCTTPLFTTGMSDDVFDDLSQADSKADDEPNWDKLMNEAQFVALKMYDPGVPVKTPLAHTRVSHAMSHYSPCENVESPTALLDMDNFLVQLTPEKSPKKVLTDDFDTCGSPNLVSSDLLKDDSELPVTSCQDAGEVLSGHKVIDDQDLDTVNDKLVSEQLKSIVAKNPSPSKKRLSSIKENMEPPKPRPKTDVRKPLISKPKLNSVAKPKLSLNPPGSATKRPTSEVKKTPSVLKSRSSNPVSATPNSIKPTPNKSKPVTSAASTPSIRNPILTSASKSLKFTPKNTGFRVAKRPITSANDSSDPTPYISSVASDSSTISTTSQTKPFLKATPSSQPQVPGVKRLNPPKPRSNLTLPASTNADTRKPMMAKPSQPRPSGLIKSSGLVRPATGLNSTLGSLPRPNLGSMPRPTTAGIQRPGMMRQGSSLSQSMVGSSTFSTPSLKRPGGIPNRSGLHLPSPQVLSANSSLVCSTPAAPRPRQAKGPLPSPITNVKRRV